LHLSKKVLAKKKEDQAVREEGMKEKGERRGNGGAAGWIFLTQSI